MRIIILLFLFFFLFSCSGRNESKILLKNITDEVEKNYKIPHGEVIAIYDLAGISNKKCCYFKDYAKIINKASENSAFIRKILPKIRKTDLIKTRAKEKLSIIKNAILSLHNNHNILSPSEIRKLDPDDNDSDIFQTIDNKNLNIYIEELYNLDKLTRNIPIFFPHSHSTLTSAFGMRKHPVKKQCKFHYGTDFAASKPSMPIYASADGKVIEACKLNGYGNIITISHARYFKTRYAHLSKMLVKKGDHVIRGQKIGIEGNTGNSTSSHLHFEVIFKDKSINPYDFVGRGYECQK